jgi:hypothetical protein
MAPRPVRTGLGMCSDRSRRYDYDSGRGSRGRWPTRPYPRPRALITVGPVQVRPTVSHAGPHFAKQRVIAVIGLDSEDGSFGAEVAIAEVAIRGGLCGPGDECSVAGSWLQQLSKSS